MAPTNTPSSGTAIPSLSPRSQLHVVIAISILLGFVYSFRRRSKSDLCAPVTAPNSSLRDEKSQIPISADHTWASSDSDRITDTPAPRYHAQSPLPLPTLSRENTVQPAQTSAIQGAERRLEVMECCTLNPSPSGAIELPAVGNWTIAQPSPPIDSQPQKWRQISTTERHFPTCASESASGRTSFPQLRTETVQEFRSVDPNSRQKCRRKILEFR